MERRKPQPVVDQIGILLRHQRLKSSRILRERNVLQHLMRLMEDRSRRRLVDLPGLYSDQTILQMIHPPDAVPTGDLVELQDEFYTIHLDAVQRHREAPLELDLDPLRLVRGVPRIGRPRINLLRRLRPGILQHTRLNASPPEVLIYTIRTLLRHRHRNAVLPSILDLLIPRHGPLPHRSDDPKIRSQGIYRNVEAHLIVALARRTMSHGCRAFLLGHVHQQLGDQRTP